MSVTATGDGPQITASGTMPAITVSVTTGSSGGGVSAHNDLTGKDAADQHPIAAITGLQAAIDAASNIAVAIQHFTNLDISSPHPFGADLPEGVLVELSGQTVDGENGTYVVPADAATTPLVVADDQILDAANAGRQVTVNTVIQTPYVYGPVEWIVMQIGASLVFSPQSGTTLFARTEFDCGGAALGNVDFSGALSAGAIVFVHNAADSADDGLWRFVADGSPMVRSRIEAGVGIAVRVMSTDEEWLRTPHDGWVVQSRLPSPVGETDGDVLTVSSDVLVYAAPAGGSDIEDWASALVPERGTGGTEFWGTNLNGPSYFTTNTAIAVARGALGMGFLQAGTITSLIVNITATAAGAGELADICCWDVDADGLPNDLLWSEEVAVDTTGIIRVTGLSRVMTTGKYAWGIYNQDGNAGTVTFTSAISSRAIGISTTNAEVGGMFWRESSPTAPPSSFSGWTFQSSSGVGSILSTRAYAPQILALRS